MLEQHQDSLLPRVTQGEEGHETAEKRPDLVFINRVLHIVNIHVSDPESFVRGPAERRRQGGYGKSGLRIQRYVATRRRAKARLFGDDVVLALSAFTKGVFCTDTPFFHVFSGY